MNGTFGRTLILDELEELRCFLEQRLCEAEASEDGGSATLYSSSSSSMSGLDSGKLKALSAKTVVLTEKLNTGKIHHLQLIRGSPKYVDRLVDSLRLKLSLESRMLDANAALARRKDQAIKDQAEFQTNLQTVKEKTTELQSDVEKDISGRYKGRPVNIMGGVQSV